MDTENTNKLNDCSRLVDYFVICGLDIECGLEPDRYFGKICRTRYSHIIEK